MDKIITSKNWYDAKNYNREKEAIRVCKTCNHVSEIHHEPEDYDAETWCQHDNCDCERFICKIENNLIVYEE